MKQVLELNNPYPLTFKTFLNLQTKLVKLCWLTQAYCNFLRFRKSLSVLPNKKIAWNLWTYWRWQMSHEEDKFINFPFGNTLAYLRNSQYDANLQYLVGSSHWSASSGRSSCSCGVIFYNFLVYNSPANPFVATFWVLSLIFQIDWRLFIFSTSHSVFFSFACRKKKLFFGISWLLM